MKLSDALADHFRIDTPHKKALKRLRIESVTDLLYHLPARYEDISDVQSVGSLQKDQDTVVYGQLSGLKTRKAWKSKRPIAEGYVEDGSARMKIMWFNQPYIAKMYTDGMYVKLAGKEGQIDSLETLPFTILMPAFVTSELKTAFQIGFLLYIPFLILDMVVASVLMAMGMMMLPPVIISMPFKLLLFVLVDGWQLVTGSILRSFN